MPERSSVVYLLMDGSVDVYSSATRAVQALKQSCPRHKIQHPEVHTGRHLMSMNERTLVLCLRHHGVIVANSPDQFDGTQVDLVRKAVK